jgi:integrase
MDADVPGLGVRVTDKGQRTFVLLTRYPGSTNPTRRALGDYGVLTLEKAREKARHWHDLIRRGTDPRLEQQRLQIAEQQRHANSFGTVAEDFIRLALVGSNPKKPKQRTGHATAREIRKEFQKLWARPIDSITSGDIVTIIDGIAAGERNSPAYAHNVLGHVRRMFNWAISRGLYGLERSPCDRMKPSQIIGSKILRDRVLSDSELRAFWAATQVMGYPFGPLFRLLALTGQRKSEIAEAQWSEVDLGRKLLTIPAERMKGNALHVVPLTAEVMAILDALPRYQKGEFLFTTTFGRRPVSGFSKAKTRLDALMLAELKNAAVERGEALERVTLPPFVLHDIRRTMRTNLSALPIPDMVRELVIAHARPGLHKVYDQHAYLDEKRHALELWAARLRDIVQLPPANVVKIHARA